MTATLFLGYVFLVAVAVIVAAFRFLQRPTAIVVALGLPVWLCYVGALSWFGVLQSVPGRPPGILLVFVPTVVFVAAIMVRSPVGGRIALAVPLWLLIGAQSFRVGVEALLHRLWEVGLAPQMLTYEGENIDAWIGLTAIVAAAFASFGRPGLRIALAWNVIGLLSLANVIVRSVLTAPGPLHLLESDIPNLFVATFPYSLLPGFFPPLAVSLHILAIRSIRHRLREDTSGKVVLRRVALIARPR